MEKELILGYTKIIKDGIEFDSYANENLALIQNCNIDAEGHFIYDNQNSILYNIAEQRQDLVTKIKKSMYQEASRDIKLNNIVFDKIYQEGTAAYVYGKILSCENILDSYDNIINIDKYHSLKLTLNIDGLNIDQKYTYVTYEDFEFFGAQYTEGHLPITGLIKNAAGFHKEGNKLVPTYQEGCYTIYDIAMKETAIKLNTSKFDTKFDKFVNAQTIDGIYYNTSLSREEIIAYIKSMPYVAQTGRTDNDIMGIVAFGNPLFLQDIVCFGVISGDDVMLMSINEDDSATLAYYNGWQTGKLENEYMPLQKLLHVFEDDIRHELAVYKKCSLNEWNGNGILCGPNVTTKALFDTIVVDAENAEKSMLDSYYGGIINTSNNIGYIGKLYDKNNTEITFDSQHKLQCDLHFILPNGTLETLDNWQSTYQEQETSGHKFVMYQMAASGGVLIKDCNDYDPDGTMVYDPNKYLYYLVGGDMAGNRAKYIILTNVTYLNADNDNLQQ